VSWGEGVREGGDGARVSVCVRVTPYQVLQRHPVPRRRQCVVEQDKFQDPAQDVRSRHRSQALKPGTLIFISSVVQAVIAVLFAG
jgi:hypothetical protein